MDVSAHRFLLNSRRNIEPLAKESFRPCLWTGFETDRRADGA